MVGEDTGATRQSRRERTLTTKMLEQEKRKNKGQNYEDSDGNSTDYAIEVEEGPPRAPRPNRIQSRPRTPSRTAKRIGKEMTMAKDDLLLSILASMEELKISNTELKASTGDLVKELTGLKAQLAETKAQWLTTEAKLAETKAQLTKTETQLTEVISITSTISGSGSGTSIRGTGSSPSGSPPLSYASALTRSINPSSSASQPVHGVTSATPMETLYCTIDTSRIGEENQHKAHPGAIRKAIEQEIRGADGGTNWRCAAVLRDSRNTERIKIACRDESELEKVKEAAQKTVPTHARVLRDQLYPVKVDNANRTAVLDQEGNILTGAAEALGKENDVNIAKIAWLSKKDVGKAYGSMVVYVTKGSEAVRLLQEQYFHVAGESAYTRVYEYRIGLTQCYKCQHLGHKAYACTKAQVCAKCAKGGHNHKECSESVMKCALCNGPHESFSKNCRVLQGHPTEK